MDIATLTEAVRKWKTQNEVRDHANLKIAEFETARDVSTDEIAKASAAAIAALGESDRHVVVMDRGAVVEVTKNGLSLIEATIVSQAPVVGNRTAPDPDVERTPTRARLVEPPGDPDDFADPKPSGPRIREYLGGRKRP